MSEKLRFLPWARRAGADVDELVVKRDGHPQTIALSHYGPGDFVGIARDQILRREPAPGSNGFAPNLLAFIELRAADLPWQPVVAGAAPVSWLALVVKPMAELSLDRIPGAALPVIEVGPEDRPNLDELRAWTHVQIAGEGTGSIGDVLARQPQHARARIVCPRRLEPRTRYAAFLVPALEAARLAGIGQTVPDPRATTPAWVGVEPVVLPVYDAWTFETAERGDFEMLARRLVPSKLAEDSSWQVDLRAVSGDVDGAVTHMPGVLRVTTNNNAWTGAAGSAARTRLEAMLATEDEVVVGVSSYGTRGTQWRDDLDLDPRWRAAAALGSEVVRRDQERLVTETWRQLGELRRINAERDRATLGDRITARLVAKHLVPQGGAAAFVAVANAGKRLRIEGTALAAKLAGSTLPPALLSAPFRRMAAAKAPRAQERMPTALATVASRAPTIGRPLPTPSGLPTAARIKAARSATVPPIRSPLTPLARTSVERGVEVLRTRSLATSRVPRPAVLDVATWGDAVVAQLGQAAARKRFDTRVDLGDRTLEVSPTASVVATIDIAIALVDQLIQLDRRHVAPAIKIVPDTVGVLAVESRFVEAFLAGANQALIREMQWRGAPIDPSATPLRQFFDLRGSTITRDIPPIASWGTAASLGDQLAARDAAVVVIRGELVRRFPDALVYIARAARTNGIRKPVPGSHVLPLFRGTLADDTIFLGFDRTPEQLRDEAGQGWFVVIAERVAAPRFGFDEPDGTTTTPATWNDLSWAHVTLAHGHVSIGETHVPALPGPQWSLDGAHIAGITLQRAVTLAIHANDLLEKP